MNRQRRHARSVLRHRGAVHCLLSSECRLQEHDRPGEKRGGRRKMPDAVQQKQGVRHGGLEIGGHYTNVRDLASKFGFEMTRTPNFMVGDLTTGQTGKPNSLLTAGLLRVWGIERDRGHLCAEIQSQRLVHAQGDAWQQPVAQDPRQGLSDPVERGGQDVAQGTDIRPDRQDRSWRQPGDGAYEGRGDGPDEVGDIRPSDRDLLSGFDTRSTHPRPDGR